VLKSETLKGRTPCTHTIFHRIPIGKLIIKLTVVDWFRIA